MKLRVLFVFLAVLLWLGFTSIGAPAQALGDSSVKASIPSPGFPEGIAVRGNNFLCFGSRRLRVSIRFGVCPCLRH